MGDEPEAPPEEQSEEQEQRYPFMQVNAAGDAHISVKAGWAEGEGDVAHLAINYEGVVGTGATASVMSAAEEWYGAALATVEE
jgi:hypothetical protein